MPKPKKNRAPVNTTAANVGYEAELWQMAEAGTSIAWRAKPVVRARAIYSLDYSGLDGVINLFE